jgi:hypothetical protein
VFLGEEKTNPRVKLRAGQFPLSFSNNGRIWLGAPLSRSVVGGGLDHRRSSGVARSSRAGSLLSAAGRCASCQGLRTAPRINSGTSSAHRG